MFTSLICDDRVLKRLLIKICNVLIALTIVSWIMIDVLLNALRKL